MRRLLVIIPIFFVLSFSHAQNFNDIDAQTYEVITMPDQSVHKLVDILDRVQGQLKISMFHLSQYDLVNKLIDLGNRGVQIQILLDQNILKEASSQGALRKITSSPGAKNIQIRPSSSGFSITHTKAMLIDNKSLFISSINFSGAISYSRDFGLIWSNADDIREFNAVFDNDWNLSGTAIGTTPVLSSDKLVWSPVNSEDKILGLISEAQKDLKVEVENLGSYNVQNALIAAAARGVQVQVVMSLCTEGTVTRNWPFIDKLVNAGVMVKVMPESRDLNHPYIHAKLILADGENFYLGSENFSANSLEHAREVGIVTRSSQVVSQIDPIFKADWNYATDWKSAVRVCSSHTNIL